MTILQFLKRRNNYVDIETINKLKELGIETYF